MLSGNDEEKSCFNFMIINNIHFVKKFFARIYIKPILKQNFQIGVTKDTLSRQRSKDGMKYAHVHKLEAKFAKWIFISLFTWANLHWIYYT